MLTKSKKTELIKSLQYHIESLLCLNKAKGNCYELYLSSDNLITKNYAFITGVSEQYLDENGTYIDINLNHDDKNEVIRVYGDDYLYGHIDSLFKQIYLV